jgi:LCP family protein required for cell wall assembly
LRFLAWGVPALVLSAGGIVLGIYLYVLGQVTVGTGADAARRPQAHAFRWPLRLVDRVNVLLIGVDITLDNRRRILNVARADTLILTSFDPERGFVAALSIPRDTRVEIPGHGVNKINTSYAFGGPGLTIQTVERLLGVTVHYYAKLGPESFGQLIDAIGGVEVDVEKDMKYTDSWAGYTIDLKKGRQLLNGEQATGYIRFRHDPLGDIGRVDRQRKVMHALLQQLKRPSTILDGPRLLQAFAANTQSDLNPVELATLGLFVLRAGGNPLREHTLPGFFTPTYWEPDLPKMRAMAADLFYGVTAEELASTTIEIQNGSGVPGLGWQVAARLEAVGFTSIRVRQAPAPAEVTTVVDHAGRANVARMIASRLGRTVILRAPGSSDAGVTVILARDASRGAQRAAPPAAISR